MLLPDIVDLDRKLDFEKKTVPRLRAALESDTHATLDDLLHWLRQEVSEMTPGADPLPALTASIVRLCTIWEAELATQSLFQDFRDWAAR